MIGLSAGSNSMRLHATAVAVSLLALAWATGCGGSSQSTSTGTAPASSSAIPSERAASAPASADWPTYHSDLRRNGKAQGAETWSSIRRNWTSQALDGDIYAEPLVVGARVLVATE